MKRIFLSVILVLSLIRPCLAIDDSDTLLAISPPFLLAITGSSPVRPDYSALPSCKGYWQMNGDVNELDRSSNGETLLEYGSVYLIPDECTTTNTPEYGCTGSGTASGFIPSGWSSNTKGRHPNLTGESLYHADGGSTDIYGADAKLSICVWYRPDDPDPEVDEYLVSKYESTNDQRSYSLTFDNALGQAAFSVSSGGTSATTTRVRSDTDPHADANPHLFCGVSNDSVLKIYVDGYSDATPVAHTAGIFNSDSTAPFIISGQEETGDTPAYGTFIEVGIWDDELTADDILNIYNYGINGRKGANDSTDPPVGSSTVVASVTWDFANKVTGLGEGSDIWNTTWADDGATYMGWGDGWGMENTCSSNVTYKSGTGVTKATGTAASPTYTDVCGSTNCGADSDDCITKWPGSQGKLSSIIAVGSYFYAWVNNQDTPHEEEMFYSSDYGETWTDAPNAHFLWSSGDFLPMRFVQIGQASDISGAYIYFLGKNYLTETAWYLGRVAKSHNSIIDKVNYEYFSGTYSAPEWSNDIADRAAVFTDTDTIGDFYTPMWDSTIQRYVIPYGYVDVGLRGEVRIIDAPDMYGPWNKSVDMTHWGGYSTSGSLMISSPTRWASSNNFYIIYSSTSPYDSYNMVKGTFQTGSIFVKDSFTESSDTALTSHTGETGATWALVSGYSYGGTVYGTPDNLGITASQNSAAYASGTPASVEYNVEAKLTQIASGGGSCDMGLLARVDTGSATFYMARYSTGTGAWEMYKFINGTPTLLDSDSATLTTNEPYHMRFEIKDATKKLFIDGVEILSSADNTITDAGKVGIRTYDNSDYLRLDDFLAYN